jgi:hypothetical protein
MVGMIPTLSAIHRQRFMNRGREAGSQPEAGLKLD